MVTDLVALEPFHINSEDDMDTEAKQLIHSLSQRHVRATEILISQLDGRSELRCCYTALQATPLSQRPSEREISLSEQHYVWLDARSLICLLYTSDAADDM
eukprot:3471133-Prymnesium_polylepis.3